MHTPTIPTIPGGKCFHGEDCNSPCGATQATSSGQKYEKKHEPLGILMPQLLTETTADSAIIGLGGQCFGGLPANFFPSAFFLSFSLSIILSCSLGCFFFSLLAFCVEQVNAYQIFFLCLNYYLQFICDFFSSHDILSVIRVPVLHIFLSLNIIILKSNVELSFSSPFTKFVILYENGDCLPFFCDNCMHVCVCMNEFLRLRLNNLYRYIFCH